MTKKLCLFFVFCVFGIGAVYPENNRDKISFRLRYDDGTEELIIDGSDLSGVEKKKLSDGSSILIFWFTDEGRIKLSEMSKENPNGKFYIYYDDDFLTAPWIPNYIEPSLTLYNDENMRQIINTLVENNVLPLSDYENLEEKVAATEVERHPTENSKAANSRTAKVLAVGLSPLLYLGLSVGMREGAYRNNFSDNFLGSVNGFAAMTIGGGIGLALLSLPFVSDISSAGFPVMAVIIGFIAGAIIDLSVPAINRSFKENAVLYYSAPVTVSILSIYGLIRNLTE